MKVHVAVRSEILPRGPTCSIAAYFAVGLLAPSVESALNVLIPLKIHHPYLPRVVETMHERNKKVTIHTNIGYPQKYTHKTDKN